MAAAAFGQLNYSPLNTTQAEATYSLPPAAAEVTDQRGLYKKVFKTNDGRIIHQVSKAPLHYKDAKGNWMPVDIKPIPTMHGFLADKQNNPVALGYDGSVEIAGATGSLFTLTTTQVFNEVIKDEPINNKTINPSLVTGKNQLFSFLTEQVIQRSEFRHNGVKVDYIFSNRLHCNDGIILQQLKCPATWGLAAHKNISHALSITNNRGEEMGILYPIVCKDAIGNISLGEYSFKKNEQGFEISLQVNPTWFNSNERIFPVVIDPLIVGPTALWGNVYMPSCDVPNYNVDSLLVTIPGQTTITGVFVSGSYYADPWAGAIMSEGQMYFSTSCGQSPNLSVAPPAGNTAGTAYLTNFDYRNPLTCCLGPSCVDRTVYIRMHLGRTAGGVGCSTSYIYYDAFTLYPFTVYIEGRTIEPTAAQWTVTPTTVCSDECDLTLKPFIKYGVPPYTITHPWASGPVTAGTPVFTCALNGVTVDLPLTRPNCPLFCDTATGINIPLPTITDACGNPISGLPPKIVNIKPTPQITVATDSLLVCSNDPVNYVFNVCPPGTTVDWTTPGFVGTNTIDTSFNNPGPGYTSTTYTATATLNGCSAAPQNLTYYVSPNPQAAMSHPAVGFIEQPINFTDMSNYLAGTGGTWYWTFGDGGNATDSAATHAYLSPGTYNVCLYINSGYGCKDTICDTIQIIPNTIVLPNVLTTNADGVNDVLFFQYLPFYGVSSLTVYNRWGETVFESEDYQNNWAPVNLVDGTYFYIIKIPGHDPYTSTLNIFGK
jgi:hypothetical protein